MLGPGHGSIIGTARRLARPLGAALIGGLGFAAGRASKPSTPAGVAPSPAVPQASSPDLAGRFKELADLHASGALTDEEFAAAKARLLGS